MFICFYCLLFLCCFVLILFCFGEGRGEVLCVKVGLDPQRSCPIKYNIMIRIQSSPCSTLRATLFPGCKGKDLEAT